MLVLLAALLVILCTSFFCSLSEAALLSVGRARVEHLATRSSAGRVLKRLKDNPDRPIAAVLILNTLANTGGAALAGSEYARLFGSGHLALFTFGLTALVLTFSEFLPKALGVRHADRIALVVARPIELLVVALSPFTWVLQQIAVLLGLGGNRFHAVSIDDLRAMARLALSSKVLGREELTIIEAAARLPKVKVNQIMIHRHDIVYVSLAQLEESLVRIRRSQHSRVLLCRSSLDDLVGLVSMKSVLWRMAEEGSERRDDGLLRLFGEDVREPLFVEPTADVSQLIRLFARHHEHLAVVRGADGRVVGIVTLEDVVEELMGEIDDEFDRAPSKVEPLEGDGFRLGGGVLWPDVERTLGLPIGQLVDTQQIPVDLDGRVDMHDLTAARLRGRLRTGAAFRIGPWRLKVARMRRGKVVYVEAVPLGSVPPGISSESTEFAPT